MDNNNTEVEVGSLCIDIIVTKEQPPLQLEVLLVNWGSHWALPGDTLPETEVRTPEMIEAIARQMLEEDTGLVVEEKNIKFFGLVSDWGHRHRSRVDACYRVHYSDPFTHAYLHGLSDDTQRWFHLDDLPYMLPVHVHVIKKVLMGLEDGGNEER